MNTQVYYFLHVLGVLIMFGMAFKAFAAPQPEKKGKTMMISGIASLVVFIAGFALIGKLGYEMLSGWIIVKLVAWLGLGAVSGIAYRKPESAGTLSLVATVLVLVAVFAVYFKPF